MHQTCKYAVYVLNNLHFSDHQSLVVRIWICGDGAERYVLFADDSNLPGPGTQYKRSQTEKEDEKG